MLSRYGVSKELYDRIRSQPLESIAAIADQECTLEERLEGMSAWQNMTARIVLTESADDAGIDVTKCESWTEVAESIASDLVNKFYH